MRTISYRRMGWAGVLTLLLAVAACGDDPVRPDPIEGAGLRLVFEDPIPEGAVALVALWRATDVAPPTCLLPPLEAATRVGVSTAAVMLTPAQPDLCSRGAYVIRNLLGDTVKAVAEEAWVGRAPSWDKRDDDGVLVPGGIYPIRWQCLDSQNPFEFNGHFYVYGADEAGACSWLVWSDYLDVSNGGSRFEITGFPETLTILTVAPGTEETQSVTFTNPYLLQVHVSGRPTYGQAVTFEEGSFTEARVSLNPAS